MYNTDWVICQIILAWVFVFLENYMRRELGLECYTIPLPPDSLFEAINLVF